MTKQYESTPVRPLESEEPEPMPGPPPEPMPGPPLEPRTESGTCLFTVGLSSG